MSKIIYQFMEDELIRMLLSDVTDLTYIFDTEGNILFVNKIFEKFTGHRPEEFYGKSFVSLFDEENLKKTKDAYARTLKGECSHYEVHFKNTRVFCDCKNFPLKDERGNIIGVVGIARDITARKQVVEELTVINESLEKRMVDHSAKLIELNEELMEEVDGRKRLEGVFKQNIEKLQKSLRGVIQALALAIESKDSYAAGHQRRVSQLARCIAREMDLSKDKVEGVTLAATLHDIGKISVPVEILSKPDQLTEDEFNVIKSHPLVGHDLLKEIEFPYPVAQIVLQHHERVDGSGYPFGLSGKDILLESKILAVADVVDALSFPRIYRPPIGLDKALDEISQNRGILYDFNVVHACLIVFNEKRFKFELNPCSNLKLFEEVLLNV